MTMLVRFKEISLAFGDQKILVNANFTIGSQERVCLIGRNGAGKSSTLKLVTGEIEPDEGEIFSSPLLRSAMLEQSLKKASEQQVKDVVAEGMSDQVARIQAYQQLAEEAEPRKAIFKEMEKLESMIEAGGGWSVDAQIDATLSQLELPSSQKLSTLSGGWQRRVALARTLVSKPDLILLDEPTNHLDINTIEWLENEVMRFPGAVLFVTHDRSFMERLATRIIEIDRGNMRSWPGSYRKFLYEKEKANSEEDRHNKLFDKKLAEEEEWIRQGIKARESRNEGRVRTLETMREVRQERIARPKKPRIHLNESNEISGRKVIEARNISHSFGGQSLIKNFSLRVMRGERIGIIGNNGIGKSTLLRILLGELQPDKGSVKLGTNLQVAYFDQLRRELDTTKTVAEIVGEGRDYINILGKKKHVVGYLTDFLFSAKRAMTRVAALSGGERNRVILAKLFTKPANLLVLDEPTNDLDVETLEALESKLVEYRSTIIAVSHDREFLDRAITSVLVFETDGKINRYAGGYSDWTSQRRKLAAPGDSETTTFSIPNKSGQIPPSNTAPRKKLTYKLKLELEKLPEKISELESLLVDQQAKIDDPGFYQQPYPKIQSELDELNSLKTKLEKAVDRWSVLEQQV